MTSRIRATVVTVAVSFLVMDVVAISVTLFQALNH